MEFDAKTKQFTVDAVLAQSITTDGDTVGVVIDTQLFESLTFSLIVHSIGGSGGDHTLKLEAADDLGFTQGVVDVLEADDPKTLIGTFKTLAIVGINRVGYIGKKRFVRATIVTANASSLTGIIGVVAIQANAQNMPTVDQ